jgi:hypothetical protein
MQEKLNGATKILLIKINKHDRGIFRLRVCLSVARIMMYIRALVAAGHQAGDYHGRLHGEGSAWARLCVAAGQDLQGA